MPRDVVIDLFEVSLKFHELVETLEVRLDKETVERLKLGRREYEEGKYKVARTKKEIDRVLSA